MISSLDHLVLTVQSISRTISFYTDILGMEEVVVGHGRRALVFGNQKINLHEFKKEFLPKAKEPTPGSGDLCFVLAIPLADAILKLQSLNVAIEEGPVERTGAKGKIQSIYVRDPDGNLIELSEYVDR